jgi:hypothetical protein
MGSNPTKGDGFLRAIKIHNMPSFGGGSENHQPHVVRLYSMLKIFGEYIRDTTLAKFKDISRQLPASLLHVSAAIREL